MDKSMNSKGAQTEISIIRAQTSMSRAAFSEYFGIPYRTVENWERGERQCPDYVVSLIKYKLEKEKLFV